MDRHSNKISFFRKGRFMAKERDFRFTQSQYYRSWKQRHRHQSNTRGTEERQRSVSSNLRSKIHKRWNRQRLIQNGSYSQNIKVPIKRHVRNQGRFDERLSSCSSKEIRSKVIGVQIQRSDLPIQVSPIRSKHCSKIVLQNNESISSEMESKRHFGIHLSRRYFGGKSFKGSVDPRSRYCSKRFRRIWIPHSKRQVCLRTNSFNRIPRCFVRFSSRFNQNSRRQKAYYFGIHRRATQCITETSLHSMQESCQVSGKVGVSNNCQQVPLTIHVSSPKEHGFSSIRKRVACLNANSQRCIQGSFDSKGINSKERWSSVRIGLDSPSDCEFRRDSSRFRHSLRFNRYCWKVRWRRAHQHQCQGIKCSAAILQASRRIKSLSRFHKFRIESRQHGSRGISKERLWIKGRSCKDSKRHCKDFNEKELVDLQSNLHPIQGKLLGRQVESSNGLGIYQGTNRISQPRIWNTPCGQICNNEFGNYPCIQFMERERRVQKSMGKRLSELLCSSNRIDQSSSHSPYQIQVSSDICNSRMELLDLVASTLKIVKKEKKYHKKDAFNQAIIRVVEQIRRNDVHNCSFGWKFILQTRDLGMMVSVGEDTFKLYTRNYNGFLWFITAFNISMDDPYAIEYYAAYLTIQGQTSRVEALRPSLQYWANIERRVLPISWSYDKVKRGITLIWSLIDRKALKRDPIFYHHIEDFIQRKDQYDPFIFKLTSAMLVIGFRLFARPGELARLKWSYVTKLKNGNIKLDLSGHKTDFFLLEKPITIDKHLENPLVCPVKLLFDYMDAVKHFKNADSPLFSLQDNLFFDTEDISQLIKNAMFSVDSEIKVSGHSLRIGATTESIIKGIPTQDIIMGTRHKDVKSLQPYQRQEALAARNLSTTLLSRDNIH